jgi:hypothetical protein
MLLSSLGEAILEDFQCRQQLVVGCLRTSLLQSANGHVFHVDEFLHLQSVFFLV